MCSSAKSFNDSIIDFIYRNRVYVKNIRFNKGEYIYVSGGGGSFYFIEKGCVRISTQTKDGRICNIGFYKEGDFFGESGFSGDIIPETATALVGCIIKKINFTSFLEEMKEKDILYEFIIYMANKIMEHQRTISSFVIFNSEKRLAYTLMRMSSEVNSENISSIKNKVSYQDLSYMIGTTRSRIGYFMSKLIKLGIIKESKERFLIVDKKRIEEYLME
ncbi:Crp/Fnr family transcriptional regulator [Xenorhabdus sp. TS4]|uniref:Crp/Fnr family transcriptional regulator n=1 Tax=Xenorhabdus sp. TS4 TaxID=1873483 RepID=UPI001656A6B0|nr:Crp/Fnr family transcriptional regulator [Xenorhabdus sp. TS4]MBC8949923.1 cAMP-regulatory protein [Xenorhabdus sp. TS4]